ncbi:MAG TPA: MMPL family transporter [Solirubrobacteraceae bacterium]|nr:MMPL family transporter [Solirubrobacteraceae bacterium]
MLSLARWSMRYRRTIVGLWVVVLVGSLAGLSGGLGNHFSNSSSLPGTGSQRASDLLRSRFPAQAGDTDQIVFRARTGELSDPSVRAPIDVMLARVARLPHVVGVIGPYTPGARAISPSGTIGFATVAFDQQSDLVPTTAINRVVNVARSIGSSRLEVELGGAAVERTVSPGVGAATAIAIGAAIVVLLLSFGSLLAMTLPILTALFGLGTSTGLIAVVTHLVSTPNWASEVAILVGLGVGIDYSLFVVTRFREAHHLNGGNVEDAIAVAMDTAGRSIAFAGSCVVIAMLGMFSARIDSLYGVAIATSVTVLVMLLAALTLLPALLSWSGARIGAGRRARTSDAGGAWARWAELVGARPAVCALVATALMLLLAAPALGLRLASGDAGNDPPSTTTHKAYELLAAGFGRGFNEPLVVAAQLPPTGGARTVAQLTDAIGRTRGVASVATPQLNATRDTAVITVYPTTPPASSQTYQLVTRLRDRVIAPIERETAAHAYVGGWTATQVDYAHVISNRLPVFIAVVIGVSALLLLLVFRSLVIPIQAAVMNLLTFAASLGVVQAIFERGWLDGVFGAQQEPIESWLPVIMFAVVFGLSMDYEVFLISRIHEEWRRTGDHVAAIKRGLSSSGRVITAAAAVMIVVFASFALGGSNLLKLIGLALASAVLLDALVIRTLLLPAVLGLLGPRAWWFPRWLARRIPVVAVEPRPSVIAGIPEPVASDPAR